jgi:hypothetical protein
MFAIKVFLRPCPAYQNPSHGNGSFDAGTAVYGFPPKGKKADQLFWLVGIACSRINT